MIRQSEIRGFVATYHRNGVAGNGFFACAFKWRMGRELIDMTAVVFTERGNCAVLSTNPDQRWRGDDFEPALREAIRLQDENQPERAYQQVA
jgi:hypothetical protein